MEFQSTPPVKAATMRSSYHFRIYAISIHAAREGGDCLPWFCGLVIVISIHAAREGGDWYAFKAFTAAFIISIHAAREGGDGVTAVYTVTTGHFNPRRP